MNKYIAEIIDIFALQQLHRKKSIASHFNNTSNINEMTTDQIHKFYTEPKLPIVKQSQLNTSDNYLIGKYSFESEITCNNTGNKYATGLYRKNTLNEGAVNVVLVHGWRMENMARLDGIYLKSLMKMGCNMYYFTLPFHFERNSKDSLYNGEHMISSDIDRTLLSVQQAVSDLRALIKWLRNNTTGKIVLIGVSLGGFLANLTGIVERDIDVLISVFYANNLAYSIWNTMPGKYIKKDLVENSFSYEELKQAWAIITPGLFKPIVPKENILLFSALYDKYVSVEDAEILWEAWERPQRVIYKCGHAGIAMMKEKIASDSMDFMSKIL